MDQALIVSSMHHQRKNPSTAFTVKLIPDFLVVRTSNVVSMDKLPFLGQAKWDALMNAFQPVEFGIEEAMLKRGDYIKSITQPFVDNKGKI